MKNDKQEAKSESEKYLEIVCAGYSGARDGLVKVLGRNPPVNCYST